MKISIYDSKTFDEDFVGYIPRDEKVSYFGAFDYLYDCRCCSKATDRKGRKSRLRSKGSGSQKNSKPRWKDQRISVPSSL